MPLETVVPATPVDAIDDARIAQAFDTLTAHTDELRAWAQAWWDAWNSQDVDAIVALVHQDITYKDPSMLGEHICGHEQFRDFVAMFLRAFPDATFEQSDWPVYAALDGVGVAVPWRVHCTFTGDMRGGPSPLALAPTGKPVVVEGVDLYAFQDGLLHRWASVVNALEILEQVTGIPTRRMLSVLNPLQRAVAPILRRLPAPRQEKDGAPGLVWGADVHLSGELEGHH